MRVGYVGNEDQLAPEEPINFPWCWKDVLRDLRDLRPNRLK